VGSGASYCSEKGTLVAWLCTIARRRAIDRLRQQNAYLRATDRYEVSCQSSNGFNESHTVSAKTHASKIMPGTKARGTEVVKADPYEAVPRQTIAE
jgi:DNA-directed RNA polymerase specialized sigma24 family protein